MPESAYSISERPAHIAWEGLSNPVFFGKPGRDKIIPHLVSPAKPPTKYRRPPKVDRGCHCGQVAERLGAVSESLGNLRRGIVYAGSNPALSPIATSQGRKPPDWGSPSVEPARAGVVSGRYVGRQHSDNGLGRTSIAKGHQGVIHRLPNPGGLRFV